MKKLLLPLLWLFFTNLSIGQDTLFSPIKFEPSQQYNSKTEGNKNQETVVAQLADVALYIRNGELFLSYNNDEYKIPNSYAFKNIKSIRFEDFFDPEFPQKFLVIETTDYDAKTSSIWNQWFNNSRWVHIIDLDDFALVGSFVIEHSYSETEYIYEGNITDSNLSEIEFKKLVENREENHSSCNFKYSYNLTAKGIMFELISGTPNELECFTTISNGFYARHYRYFKKLK